MKTKFPVIIWFNQLTQAAARPIAPMLRFAGSMIMAALLALLAVPSQAAETIVWQENFDDGNGDARWYADQGVWEMGTSTKSGGAKTNAAGFQAYSGNACAVTTLSGNYSSTANSRLIRIDSFVVPAAGQYPRLRFWHWYNFAGYGSGYVEVREVGGTNTNWATVSADYSGDSSGVWTRPSIDLRAYAGKTIQVAFHITTAYNYSGVGWYVDDVALVTGTPTLPNPEGFEGGLGDWFAERGVWEVGVPTSGPPTNAVGQRAYLGTNCAATVLGGNYSGSTDSRLVSPEFVVPAAGQYPRLRFWHWYNFASYGSGYVEVREVGGTNTNWATVSADYSGDSSGVWTRPSVDLRAYAGKTIQIAFHATTGYSYGGVGWYVDDVAVVTGSPSLPNPEGFEGGLGDWFAERGVWEVGVPTSGPPTNAAGQRAYLGTNCAATVLGGNYSGSTDSRLVSPEFVVPAAGQYPRLRFWHWYNFASYGNGYVEVREVGGTNTNWATVSADYSGDSSGVWTRPSIDLRAYAGKTIQIAFHATTGYGYGGVGWYVDDVALVTGTPSLPNPEGFEGGLGDWFAERGVWEVGVPMSGPPTNAAGQRAYLGTNCAATVLGGNYSGSTDSRLVSPEFVVPTSAASPVLRFRHWFAFASYGVGRVQIKVGTNSWVDLAGASYSESSGVWTYPFFDLSSYAGSAVRVAFYATTSYGYSGIGWYIDQITIQNNVLATIPSTNINEEVLWTYVPTVIGTGYTFTLQNAPAGMTVNSGNGTISWMPTEAQGPGTYTNIMLVVHQTGSGLSPVASQSFSVTVNEVNAYPIIDPIANQSVAAGALLSFTLPGHDPDRPLLQTLTYSLEGTPPSGTVINAASGLFTWTPTLAQGGVFNLSVRATDNGTPALSTNRAFQVTVLTGNQSPILPLQTNRTIAELTQLVVTNTAGDADAPTQTLTYTLVSPPSGATISTNGIIQWIPSEAQGPSTNLFTTIVADNGSPILSATNQFYVFVTEVNTAPRLVGPASINVTNPAAINVAYSGTDGDVPVNTLVFAKVSGPVWLSFTQTGTTTNATLTGTPPTVTGVSNYLAILSVADNGSPALSNQVTVAITVNPALLPPVIGSGPASRSVLPGSNVVFVVSATGTALTYQWRFNSNAIPSATSATLSVPNAQRGNQGYYDVIVSNAAGSVTSAPPARLTVNTPPVWTSTPVLLATQGQPYLYLLEATDADNDPLSFTAPTLPAWLTLDCSGTGGVTTTAISGLGGNATQWGAAAGKQAMSRVSSAPAPASGIDWLKSAQASAAPVPNHARVSAVRTVAGEGTFAPTVKSQEPFDPGMIARPRIGQSGTGQVVVNPSAAQFPDILLNITVLDAANALVSGLRQSDFTVQEQSSGEAVPVAETITSFQETSAGAGISFSLVFDVSGSMSSLNPVTGNTKLADTKVAAISFLGNTTSADRGNLVKFAFPSQIAIVKASNWVPTDSDNNGTTDLVAAIQSLVIEGGTAVFDGAAKGIESLSQEPNPRAVILFTDGDTFDDVSYNINTIIAKARNEGVPIYSIGLGTDVVPARLSQMATNTGGSYYYAPTPGDMAAIYNSIARQVRSRYAITYRTHTPVYDGTLRTVTVGANSTSGSGTYRVNGTPVIALDAATVALSTQSQAAGVALRIGGTVTDLDAQSQAQTLTATLYYRQTGTAAYTSVNLALTSQGAGVYGFSGNIPAGVVLTPGVEYYLRASDGVQEVYFPFNYNTTPLSIAVLPNRAPVIVHTPVTSAPPGVAINIAADVTDADAGDSVSSVVLNYRLHNVLPNTPYHPVTMVRGAGNTYSGAIPGSDVTAVGVDYFISAWDSRNVRADAASALVPYFISVGAGCRLVGTPGAAEVGTHTVVLNVTDGIAVVPQTFTITVVGTNSPPQLLGRTTLAVTNPAVVNESYTATDNAVTASSLVFTKVSGPAWLSFTKTGATNASLTGTPPTVTGVSNYPVVLSVADSGSPSLSSQLTVTITVSPAPPAGSLQFAQSANSVGEAEGSVTLTVTRTGGTNGAVSADYFTTAGTAAAGADFVATSGRLNWTAGDSAAKTFAVSIVDDSVVETNETFTVTLSNPVGASIGSPGVATVTISDNDTNSTPTCFVVRQLPSAYSPGIKFTVHLVATPVANTSSYAVEDVPPTGWTVGAVDQGGSFDGVTGKVKFGSFADATARTLSYELTPPGNAVGRQTFAGTGFAATGLAAPVSSAICGPSTVDFIFRHPADVNSPFGQITADELVGYEAAWKIGQPWPLAPTNIPISFVSRAGAIWRGGEQYRFDPNITIPPLWWVTNTAGTIVVQSFGGQRVTAGVVAQDVMPPGVAWADLPGGFQRGQAMTVVIHVRPGGSVHAYAVEETLPLGWQIVTNSISDAGGFDGAAGKVKWGTFSGLRDLSYTIISGTNEAPALFSGVVSFDGVDVPVGGRRLSVRAPWVPDVGSLNTNRNVVRDGFRLVVQGETGTGRRIVIEGSDTPWIPGSWLPVATNLPGATVVDFTDPAVANRTSRFYRVIER